MSEKIKSWRFTIYNFDRHTHELTYTDHVVTVPMTWSEFQIALRIRIETQGPFCCYKINSNDLRGIE